MSKNIFLALRRMTMAAICACCILSPDQVWKTNAQEIIETEMEEALNRWTEFAENEEEFFGYEPAYTEILYDCDLNPAYLLIGLSDEVSGGYAVVSLSDDHSILEAAVRTASPYADCTDIKVYVSPLNYYSVNGTLAVDLITDTALPVSELHSLCPKDGSVSLAGPLSRLQVMIEQPNVLDASVYVTSYSSWFVPLSQPYAYTCVPTSFAMFYKYMVNRGKFTNYYSGTNTNMIYNLFNRMASYVEVPADSGIYVWRVRSDAKVKSGFEGFISDYTPNNVTVSYQNTTVSTFSAICYEIDSSYPAIIVVNSNHSLGYGTNHAVTVVGYKTEYNSSTGITDRWLWVVDPNDGIKKMMSFQTWYFNECFTVQRNY